MNYRPNGKNLTRKEIKEQKRTEAEARNAATLPENKRSLRRFGFASDQ
jgi:hypothetical protein